MVQLETTLQTCPTRIDGAPVLFAHKVDRARCQERQRKRYHKCFTCAWNNSYVGLHGAPPAQAQVSTAKKAETSALEVTEEITA